MAFGKNILTWFEGRWHEGNPGIMKAADHGTWLGTMVFDGARTFDGVTPDLDLHCQRMERSARAMGMVPAMGWEEIMALAEEGIGRYAPDQPLYIRPMMWSTEGHASLIDPVAESTAFALCIEDIPLKLPEVFSLTISPWRRPEPDQAVTEAKASSLYANNGRIVAEAKSRGFSNALSLDVNGHVAETSSANVFMVRDGEVLTPKPNGMFLAGITRFRTIELLRADGVTVREVSLTPEDFATADEIFLTANAAKVWPATQFEDRMLETGFGLRARALYWDYAKSLRMAA